MDSAPPVADSPSRPAEQALLAAKLTLPPPRPGGVPRPRLLARLDEGLAAGHSLLLLLAPPGWGKTTLISAWAAHLAARLQPVVIGAVALDPGDNDPLRFWPYLLTALDRMVPGAGAAALALFQAPQPPPI